VPVKPNGINMIKDIIIFSSVDDAVITLNKFASEFEFPVNKKLKEKVIFDSVSSNIFRAFHIVEHSPSTIFRGWATENFELVIKDLNEVKSNEDYYDLVFKYGDSLIKRWADKTLQKESYLIYGQSLKMINLVIKTSQQSILYSLEDKIKYQQVPFDSFSLKPLRLIINKLTGLNYKINIPINVTMGFINTPQLYRIIMDSVYKLCNEAQIDPIIYDYWCWEDKH
jgi:hypothetical protein